jgi:hypothetical protein
VRDRERDRERQRNRERGKGRKEGENSIILGNMFKNAKPHFVRKW